MDEKLKILESFAIYVLNCCGGEHTSIPDVEEFPTERYSCLEEYLKEHFEAEISILINQVDAAEDDAAKSKSMLHHFIPFVDSQIVKKDLSYFKSDVKF